MIRWPLCYVPIDLTIYWVKQRRFVGRDGSRAPLYIMWLKVIGLCG
jgi:hypothetical protein